MFTESTHVALCLSGVARLFLAFHESTSPSNRQLLLQAAGDLLDKTMPYPEVKKALAETSDQVGTLVAHRERIGAVPPGLWRKDKVSPNELGGEHYAGWRALERALRRDFSNPDALWSTLDEWLTPAWEVYPELKAEALSARPSFSSQG